VRHWTLQIATIIVSVGGFLGFMHAVHSLGTRLDWPAEMQRKSVHVATGAFALILPVLFQQTWPVLLLIGATIATMAVLRMPGVARAGIGAAIHSVERKSYGDMLFAVAVGFLFFRSSNQPVLYVLPIAVLALADTAAALAGSTYGRRLFTIEAGTKSLEGVAVFFVVTWLIAMILLLLMTDIARLNVVILSFVIAAFGALVEADSWSGLDNLFLPVGLHLFLEAHLERSPLGLVALASGFIVMLAAILALTRVCGLANHSARTYAVALFLICCYTAPQNAILPTLAVVTHVWSNARAPSHSPYTEFEVIGSVAAVSLLWMFVGEQMGPTAINFYTMTFAGITAALVVLGTSELPPVPKWIAGLAALSILVFLFDFVVGIGPAASRWHGSLVLPAITTLIVGMAATAYRPALFERFRCSRVALVASAVPALTYFTMVTR
jgi:phytol kinase